LKLANIEKSCKGVDKNKHAFLEDEQAKEFFMFHAFKYAIFLTNDFKNIYMQIIKACKSLPLSLKILGCYLRDIHDLEVWKGALHELKGG
jgi:hypothetical protein